MKSLHEIITEKYKNSALENFIKTNMNEKWIQDIPFHREHNPINITYNRRLLLIEKNRVGTILLTLDNTLIRDESKMLEILKQIKKTYEHFGSYESIGSFDMGMDFYKIV